ncbi:MAG TPA: hypothetical protein PKY77_25135 [Phycisphaerae bacterium]|nr:hypothetical protein [Phycisphaerae bacterium]HRY69436.1 hypothetical protein [Phycisphaerae bacterium]HSA26303.1 hypothetical protein [Phycisphaerae bacterium]
MRQDTKIWVLATAAAAVAWAWMSAGAMAQATQPSGQDAASAVKAAEKEPAVALKPADAAQGADSEIESFIKATKNPFPWLNWGADIRARNEFVNNLGGTRSTDRRGNVMILNKDALSHEVDYQRYRARWWATVTPVKNVEFYVRLTWEGWNYCAPDQLPNPSNARLDAWEQRPLLSRGWISERDQVLFDNLYVKLTDIGGLPITVTAGRQDIILGEGWLVMDGTPLDGSRTFYFDGIRTTTNLKDIKTTFDAMWFQIDAQGDAWLPMMRKTDWPLYETEQDEMGAILYVTNRSIPNMSIEPYFMYKQNRHEEPTTIRRSGTDADIYTFGTRVAGTVGKNWKYSANVAGQFGNRDAPAGIPNNQNICAWATNNRLSYLFNDKWKNEVYFDYEYLSGDRSHRYQVDGNYEAFDVLWGRYPRWTEGYGFAYAAESRVFDLGNTHRFGPGWKASPTSAIDVGLYYNFLFADENTVYDQNPQNLIFAGGNFRGQLLVPYFKYAFNSHMFARVMPEFFFPGSYYKDASNDVGTFVRVELVFTW